jgi:hypothetical protein
MVSAAVFREMMSGGICLINTWRLENAPRRMSCRARMLNQISI